MAVVEPLMRDVCSSFSTWWKMIQDAAFAKYPEWLMAPPWISYTLEGGGPGACQTVAEGRGRNSNDNALSRYSRQDTQGHHLEQKVVTGQDPVQIIDHRLTTYTSPEVRRRGLNFFEM